MLGTQEGDVVTCALNEELLRQRLALGPWHDWRSDHRVVLPLHPQEGGATWGVHPLVHVAWNPQNGWMKIEHFGSLYSNKVQAGSCACCLEPPERMDERLNILAVYVTTGCRQVLVHVAWNPQNGWMKDWTFWQAAYIVTGCRQVLVHVFWNPQNGKITQFNAIQYNNTLLIFKRKFGCLPTTNNKQVNTKRNKWTLIYRFIHTNTIQFHSHNLNKKLIQSSK